MLEPTPFENEFLGSVQSFDAHPRPYESTHALVCAHHALVHTSQSTWAPPRKLDNRQEWTSTERGLAALHHGDHNDDNVLASVRSKKDGPRASQLTHPLAGLREPVTTTLLFAYRYEFDKRSLGVPPADECGPRLVHRDLSYGISSGGWFSPSVSPSSPHLAHLFIATRTFDPAAVVLLPDAKTLRVCLRMVGRHVGRCQELLAVVPDLPCRNGYSGVVRGHDCLQASDDAVD